MKLHIIECDSCTIRIKTDPHVVRIESNGVTREGDLCDKCYELAKGVQSQLSRKVARRGRPKTT